MLPPPPSNKRKRKAEDVLKEYETDETLPLSSQQLQRLLMLEQLSVLRLKRRQLKARGATSQYYQVVQESNTFFVSSQENRDHGLGEELE